MNSLQLKKSNDVLKKDITKKIYYRSSLRQLLYQLCSPRKNKFNTGNVKFKFILLEEHS